MLKNRRACFASCGIAWNSRRVILNIKKRSRTFALTSSRPLDDSCTRNIWQSLLIVYRWTLRIRRVAQKYKYAEKVSDRFSGERDNWRRFVGSMNVTSLWSKKFDTFAWAIVYSFSNSVKKNRIFCYFFFSLSLLTMGWSSPLGGHRSVMWVTEPTSSIPALAI